MGIFSILLIAIGLAMDAFAVSVSNGIVLKKYTPLYSLVFGLYFGAYQFFMPVVGYLAGNTFNTYLSRFSHFVAFGLLTLIGGKMIAETFRHDTNPSAAHDTKIFAVGNMNLLALATSIDAMAVGVSFSMLGTSILIPSAIIGFVAFTLSAIGVWIGSRAGGIFQTSAERLGGGILIGIGIKILLEHYLAH